MAYTSVIPVHRLDNTLDYTLNKEKSSRSINEASLESVVDEALNRDRTEQDLFQDAIGCTCETAFEDMCQIKKMWHKEKGVQGFHLVQSFAAGEGSPELAHQIGLELAQRLLGGRFQVIISTHLNTGHLHNHIVWNSVDIQTGQKYRSNQKSYVTEIRGASDDLCRKYGLSIIQTENAEKVTRPYAQWMAEQNGQPTCKTAIQQDIDTAISVAFTWKQFLRILEAQGYTFKQDRKYMTIKPPAKERPVRFKTLGKDYNPEAIQRRILYPKYSPPAGKETAPDRHFKLRSGAIPSRRITGLRALYFSYLYKMGALKKKPRSINYAVREDIRKLDQRIEQMEFIFKNKIDDRGQLAAIRREKEAEITVLVKERQKFYRYQPGSSQIEILTKQLREFRHTAKLCRNIEIHSMEMEKRMQTARVEEQWLREQEQKQKTNPSQEKER